MKKVHFIGIVASAIAPIAIMMKEKGWDVTGSDEGVFEPALSLLNNAGVKWYEGYSAERVHGCDLVIIGGGPLMKDPNNPEYLEALRLGLPTKGYYYALQEYVIKDRSIVIAGSYGKTTTSGMVNWILECAGMNPSFMIGGKPGNFTTGVRSTDSDISCLEGDEFVSVFNMDMEPRFIYYKPKYTLISASKWDHMNVYPTEKSYTDAFLKLVKLTKQNDGVLYLCGSGTNNDLLERSASVIDLRVVTYMIDGKEALLEQDPEYRAKISDVSIKGTTFEVYHKALSLGEFTTTQIGTHNVENSLGAITVCHDLGVPLEKIKEGIKSFKGIKRRLEIIGNNSKGALVIDDFAHSAMKAEASLSALRQSYPDSKIVTVYFPRQSARENREELDFYPGAFDAADLVIIPRIQVKRSTPKEQRIYGKDIIEAIAHTQPNVEYIPVEEDLVSRLVNESSDNTVIVFMSASGWGRVIDEVLR